MPTSPITTAELAAEAKIVQSKLQKLWADEGVEQLEIFLDPGIVSVLQEIKRISMAFVDRMAGLSA